MSLGNFVFLPLKSILSCDTPYEDLRSRVRTFRNWRSLSSPHDLYSCYN
jgi:hypothetical protein